jgi:3-oxoacyl-[acyl-carrier-protein] synthase-3
MYLNYLSHYLPEKRIANSYFKDINGLDDEWIFSRTGIRTRSRAAKDENTTTMAISAVKKLVESNQDALNGVDLIIGASYTPYDTIGTLAHSVQRYFNVKEAKAVYISSACSSFVNGLEIVEGYFASGKAQRALLIVSDHNTAYSDDSDEKSGHLWGDGAAAVIVSKIPNGGCDFKVIDIFSEALANIGKGPEGVYLKPYEDRLKMPFGRDVFIYACQYMTTSLKKVASKNNISLEKIDYFVPHQANIRIINNIAGQINRPISDFLINIDKYGNTGSAGAVIAVSENCKNIESGKLLGLTVFGGGYSSGAILLEKI